jgi:hypothetical protein
MEILEQSLNFKNYILTENGYWVNLYLYLILITAKANKAHGKNNSIFKKNKIKQQQRMV